MPSGGGGCPVRRRRSRKARPTRRSDFARKALRYTEGVILAPGHPDSGGGLAPGSITLVSNREMKLFFRGYLLLSVVLLAGC